MAGSGAEAATISFSGSAPAASENEFETIALGWFDTTLGTLTSALFEYTASAFRERGVRAFSGQTVSVSATSEVGVSFFGVSASDTGSASASCTAPIEGTCTATARAIASIDGSGFVDPANFALISGVGAGTVLASAFFDQLGEATVTVTYTYDPAIVPIPLPAAGGLLVAGLGGLALLRRRRAA